MTTPTITDADRVCAESLRSHIWWDEQFDMDQVAAIIARHTQAAVEAAASDLPDAEAALDKLGIPRTGKEASGDAIHYRLAGRIELLAQQLAEAQAAGAAINGAVSRGFMTCEANSPKYGIYRVVIQFRELQQAQELHRMLLFIDDQGSRDFLAAKEAIERELEEFRVRSPNRTAEYRKRATAAEQRVRELESQLREQVSASLPTEVPAGLAKASTGFIAQMQDASARIDRQVSAEQRAETAEREREELEVKLAAATVTPDMLERCFAEVETGQDGIKESEAQQLDELAKDLSANEQFKGTDLQRIGERYLWLLRCILALRAKVFESVKMRVKVARELAEVREKLVPLSKFFGEFRALMGGSLGVSGLHLNGDDAPWCELVTGGRFEAWLLSFDAALAAIEKEGTSEA